METYYYVCPVCGFVYQVPDYWVSYSPEETMDFPHINFKTGQPCTNRRAGRRQTDRRVTAACRKRCRHHIHLFRSHCCKKTHRNLPFLFFKDHFCLSAICFRSGANSIPVHRNPR